jgi:hypothetical protein
MQPTDLHTLSANVGDVIEILVGLAVFIIWVIASIAGAIKKRRPTEPTTESEEGVIVFEEQPPVARPPPPPRPARRKPKHRPSEVVSEPPSVEPRVFAREPSPVKADRMTDSNANRVSPAATALRKLLRPDTIRGGIVLSELLQPPLSLRPDRDPSR